MQEREVRFFLRDAAGTVLLAEEGKEYCPFLPNPTYAWDGLGVCQISLNPSSGGGVNLKKTNR